MSKKSPKWKKYDLGFTEDVTWNAKVFFGLQGSCLKSQLQDVLKEMVPNMKARLDSRDAGELLKKMQTDGLIKYIEYARSNHKIYALANDQLKSSGNLALLLKGIFRYWEMNIHRKKLRTNRLHDDEKKFIDGMGWELKWGHDFIKKWADFVEESMTKDMKDDFKADTTGSPSLADIYKDSISET